MHEAETICVVEQLFVKGWRHGKKAKPDVQYIFRVLWPEPVLEPYLAYRYTHFFSFPDLQTPNSITGTESRPLSKPKTSAETKSCFSTVPIVGVC